MARQVFCDEKSRDMDSSSIGICYSDISSNNNPTIHQTHHFVNQIQSFVSDPTEIIFNTNMDMIGFSKNHIHQQSFFNKLGQQQQQGASSCNTFYHHHHHHEYDNKKPCFTSGNICETTILSAHDSASASLLVDDDFSLRYVFPYEGNNNNNNNNNNNHNNTQSQGLSLSLSSNNIGLQSFELKNQQQHQPDFASSSSSRDGFYAKSYQQQMLQEGEGHFMLKNSKFLVPAQELLNEFCSLETKENGTVKHKSIQKNKESWKEDSGKNKHSLTSLEFLELHKRKTKLLSMLEEVERRYKHYRNQMKSVVSSFEAVAGNGGATVYSAMALEAMSKHFRCLKDVILDQISETKKAMGEKEEEEGSEEPCNKRKGSETPRLRMIEQKLRKQRELQQMNMIETHPWRPQRGLPQRSVSFLRAWLFQHFLHPYPNDVDKHILARQTGLSRSQVSNWFINARVRLWKPMVEEIYLEEAKDQEEKNIESSEVGTNNDEDQKPNKLRFLRIDSECVSSIINNPNHHKKDNPKNNCMNQHHEQCFGSLDIDFSSYTHHYDQNGNGVSLTLGLQQHGESEVSLAFHQATQRSSMFYTRDQIDEVEFEPIHYSILDGETQSNMPCRNLIGTQLLHDLVG